MSINFSAKKKKGRGGKNRAFLAAIALCCAAVGLVAWSSALSRNSRNTAAKAELPGELPGETPSVSIPEPDTEPDFAPLYPDTPVDNKPVIIAEPDSSVLTEPMPDAAVSVSAEPDSPGDISYSDATQVSYTLPVSGGIMCGFSGSNLVYSKTMCDWRVHQGIDIECVPGTSVTSCGSGTVYDVVVDPMFGTTVIVDCDSGASLYYCGLEKSSVAVKKGSVLKSGDIIGMVGVVPCESADGTHIHLALMKNGGYADPMTLIS